MIFVPLLLYSLVAHYAVVHSQWNDLLDGHTDFVLYYSAAKILKDGQGHRLYDLELQKEYQDRVRVAKFDRDLPFNHPPYELLAFLLPARFSLNVAHLLWAAMNLLLLALAIFRLLPFVEKTNRALCILLVLGYFPTMMALKMGQDSIITTYLLAETYVSLKRKRYSTAGALLAFGLYKPQFVLPLVGIFLLRGCWPLIVSFSLTGLWLGAVSFAMVGGAGLADLFALWQSMIQRGHVVWPEVMINLRGLTYVLLDIAGHAGANNAGTIVLSLAVYYTTLRLGSGITDESESRFDLWYALAVVGTALVSFHMYSYDGSMLVIALMIMLNRVLSEPSVTSPGRRAFLGALIVLFVPLLPMALLSAERLAWWTLPFLVIFAVLTAEIRRLAASPPGP